MRTSTKIYYLITNIFLFSLVSHAQTLRSWMNPEVGSAWKQGYRGQNTTVQVIDDFRSNSTFYGNFGDGTIKPLRHGEWTLKEISMIAPSSILKTKDFTLSTQKVILSPGLNILNLSYGMYAKAGYLINQIRWSPQEQSIIDYAKSGSAVIAKAAGNDRIAIDSTNSSGNIDYLNLALKNTGSTIFVGALSSNNGSATMATYSNIAGKDPIIQRQFLVVGVEGNKTGLYGTSFAAPIISGYAAILGSKFSKASPIQIANQLLNTARQDTVKNYTPAIYGRGEASIARALAPLAIK